MVEIKEEYIKYSFEEVQDIELDLELVETGRNIQDQKLTVGVYYPAKRLIRICSMCKKKKAIYVIHGETYIFQDLPKYMPMKMTFLLICKSCATALEL